MANEFNIRVHGHYDVPETWWDHFKLHMATKYEWFDRWFDPYVRMRKVYVVSNETVPMNIERRCVCFEQRGDNRDCRQCVAIDDLP